MTHKSGFTFIHNALHAGYPIVEAIAAVRPYVQEMVVVDMQSTDGTRELLERMDVRIVDGVWEPGRAGECLKKAHSQHIECEHDIIWHFEADEVFSDGLASAVWTEINSGHDQIAVHRIQVEQNFQRVRWYPVPVHRVFRKGTIKKEGETSWQHLANLMDVQILGPECGLLWDVTNCFRDQFLARCRQQAELWGGRVYRRLLPIHAYAPLQDPPQEEGAEVMLKQPHWTWKVSPFRLPTSLAELVGTTKYVPRIDDES